MLEQPALFGQRLYVDCSIHLNFLIYRNTRDPRLTNPLEVASRAENMVRTILLLLIGVAVGAAAAYQYVTSGPGEAASQSESRAEGRVSQKVLP